MYVYTIITFTVAECCIVQPYMIANPARGQLNRIFFFSCLRSRLIILPRETGSPVPSRVVSPLILNTRAEFGANLRDSSRFPRRRLSMPSRPVPNWSGRAIAYRWCSLPTVRRHRASSPQDSSRDGCCLFRYHHGALFSFPTPTIGMY